MAYPIAQVPGGLYHVTQRGHRGSAHFRSEGDRRDFLGLLGLAVARHRWRLYAYCLMDNHVHLLVRTPEADLSRGMAWLTGRYAQRFNVRYRTVGTPYQGRYRAFFVQSEEHLMEVVRYIVLNPVRARLVGTPGQWPWSSYRATAGLEEAPRWLAVGTVLRRFGGDRSEYRRFVAAGIRDRPMDWRRIGRPL